MDTPPTGREADAPHGLVQALTPPGALVQLSRAVKSRTVVAAVAASSLAALALPANATASSTTSAPAEGVARSSLTLLQLTVDGTTVSAGQLAAVADNKADPHVAKLVITPVTSSATGPIGRQTVTPDSGDTTVPSAPATVSLPSGLGSLTGPTIRAAASDTDAGVLAAATLKALGKVTVTTVPLDLKAAALGEAARVTDSRAAASKKVALGGLALPSLQALLAALG